MSDEMKTIKFQLMLSPSETEEIDNWGFSNRIRSRAEAIRRLCQIGMAFDDHRVELTDLTAKMLESSENLFQLATEVSEKSDCTAEEYSFALSAINNVIASKQAEMIIRGISELNEELLGFGEFSDLLVEAEKIKDTLKKLAQRHNSKPTDS